MALVRAEVKAEKSTDGSAVSADARSIET